MKYLIVLILLFPFMSSASLNEVDKTQIFNKNLLKNPGFEHNLTGWTASAGVFTHVTAGFMIGNRGASWNASAATQTLTSSAVAIPEGMYGRNGVVSCLMKPSSFDATHSIQAFDGTNVLATDAVTSSVGKPTRSSVNFIFPSSGNIQIRLLANQDEPGINIDDCYIGPAEGYNVGSVSQATFVGSGYFAGTTNCAGWTRTSGTLGAFATDSDCPGATVVDNPGPGTIQTTDYDLPKISLTNAPPGIYEIEFGVGMNQSSASNVPYASVYDGSTESTVTSFTSGVTGDATRVLGYFTYTTAGDRTFELYGASSSGTVTLFNNITNRHATFSIKRYPLTSEQAYRPDLQAMSWSGYHDNTCSLSRTNTAYGDPTADASCALIERTNTNFGSVVTYAGALPGIVFTPKKPGKYFICSTVSISGATLGADIAARLWDGTTTVSERGLDVAVAGAVSQIPLCGLYEATSLASKTLSVQTKSSTGAVTISALTEASAIEWSIVSIDQSLPAPLLVGSVVSNSSGAIKLTSAIIDGAATPTISSQTGTWLSSLTDNGVGTTALNITAGTFSTAPHCVVSNTENNTNKACLIQGAPSTSVINVWCGTASSGADGDYDFTVQCMGAP